LKDYLIDNYSENIEKEEEQNEDIEIIKLFDLKNQRDPNDYRLKYI
jgi:hypothetical protein